MYTVVTLYVYTIHCHYNIFFTESSVFDLMFLQCILHYSGHVLYENQNQNQINLWKYCRIMTVCFTFFDLTIQYKGGL